MAMKEGRGTAEGDARGGVFSALSPRAAVERVRALPSLAQRGATSRIHGELVECDAIWQSDFKQTVEASAPGAVHPDFERPLFGSPIVCDFLHRADHRPPASCGQSNPAGVEHQLRPMMAEQHVRQSEAQRRLRRGGRNH